MDIHPQTDATVDLLTIGDEARCREVGTTLLGKQGVIEHVERVSDLGGKIPLISSGMVVLCDISISADETADLRSRFPRGTIIASVSSNTDGLPASAGVDVVVPDTDEGLAALSRLTSPGRQKEELEEAINDRRTLIEAVPHAMLLLDQRAEILEANHRAVREFNLKPPFDGRAFMSILSETRRERWAEGLRQAMTSPRPVTFHEEEGSRWLMIGFYPICSSDGDLLRIAVGVSDETASRRTMNRRSIVPVIAEIFSAAKDLPQLYEHVPMVVSEQFGYPAAAFALYNEAGGEVEIVYGVGAPLNGMSFPHALSQEKTIPREAMEDTRPRVISNVLNHPDYSSCFMADYGCQTLVTVPVWAEGHPMGAILLGDELVREDAEDFLDVLHLVAHQLGSEILRRRTEIQLRDSQKLASLGTLTAGIAHEINNPNTFLLMNAPLAKEIWAGIEPAIARAGNNADGLRPGGLSFNDAVDRLPKLLDAIEDGARRIDKIVTGLKTYSRQAPVDAREMVDIGKAIESAATLTAGRIRGATEEFTVTVPTDMPRILGDRQRLEQVLINLILNACDAMPETDGRIKIQASSDSQAGMVEIVVADNGEGIPEEKLQHVMDPFFTTKRDQGGTGLGLSIAAGIVSDFGGRIEIDSRPSQGTEVQLLFPIGSQPRE